MKFLILPILMMSALTTQAMTSLSFDNLRKIDAIVETLAEGRANGLTRQRPEDVNLSYLTINKATRPRSQTANVGLGYVICTVKVTPKAVAAGMIGANSYIAQVVSCSAIKTIVAVPTMRYEDIRKSLGFFATKNPNSTLNFRVTDSVVGPVLEIENGTVAAPLQCMKTINCMPPVDDLKIKYCGKTYQTWSEKNCKVQPLILH
jgi:hypothetical protein